VKAQSKDGVVVNSLWDRISEGHMGAHNGIPYVGKSEAKIDNAKNQVGETIVPLQTSALEEALRWKSGEIRRVINSLQIVEGQPPNPVVKLGGKSYRPIWFTADRFEARLRDFVVDYDPGRLANVLAESDAVTLVTQVTLPGTVGSPEPYPLPDGSVKHVTQVTPPSTVRPLDQFPQNGPPTGATSVTSVTSVTDLSCPQCNVT